MVERTVVEIVERGTNKVLKRLGPYPNERTAQRAEGGAWINLDREQYFTRLVAPSGKGNHLRRVGR